MAADRALPDCGRLSMVGLDWISDGLWADSYPVGYPQRMTTGARVALACIAALPLLAVTACSAGPTRAEVAERYAIEWDAVYPGSSELPQAQQIIDDAVDDAFKGRCGEDAYRAQLEPVGEFALRPWDATCLMYFEDDMTQAQVDRAMASSLGLSD